MPRRLPLPALLLASALLAANTATAQLSLTTTFNNNNGQSGNMFDIVAVTTVTILGFDVNLDSGSWNMEVYVVTGGGTWQGNQTNANAWTLLGTATGVVGAGPGNPTPLSINLNQIIAPGATQGFYITSSSGTAMNYTNGTSVGSIAAQDSNIQILEGAGKSYPFASTFQPRIWNGTVYYAADGLIASFSANVTQGASPLAVNFLDQSFTSDPGGITLYEWDLDGDGSIDSNLSNPSFVYQIAGTYTVSLTVHDATHPSSTLVRADYITVAPPPLAASSLGLGDLTLTGPPDPPGTLEGYLLLSQTVPPTIGGGWFLGILPDATTFLILGLPAIPGGILHYTPLPIAFPNVPFFAPPGSLSLPGVTMDFVLIQILSFTDLRISNVARATF